MTKEEMYPLGRDETESRRLNEQHKLLLDIVGGAIDKAVPLDNISTVADVATGTGIWLWDAQKQLNENAGQSERQFHGFDISAAQFPPAPAGITFSVHDIFQPFPAEHLNRYDLVHVRLLVTAFPESEFQKAVENLLTILKPGGYLQWSEVDFAHVEAGSDDHPKGTAGVQPWMKFVEVTKISKCAPDTLYTAYNNAGLLNVANRSYPIRGRADLVDRAQEWERQFFSTMIPVILLKIGDAADKDEADEKGSKIKLDLEEYFADGGVVDVRFGTVIGQKPN
ncbi:class I SAM-dependent methyltransferase [Aspergillus puulaauensis]|uniref:Methyltransferase domain-containing protein n=1 Tax=Aspergillus puulaauensis TaxID=1220207 RepID=A0A7R7XM00_9EURO|nr:uncharacterized protein APUU_31728S [Aspergillus puulaauensis]BCS23503.1 hypothetical protein APUU_31728S [Aspergillus puulaauensis]